MGAAARVVARGRHGLTGTSSCVRPQAAGGGVPPLPSLAELDPGLTVEAVDGRIREVEGQLAQLAAGAGGVHACGHDGPCKPIPRASRDHACLPACLPVCMYSLHVYLH